MTAESRTYIHELYPTKRTWYPNRVAADMRPSIAGRLVLVEQTIVSKERKTANFIKSVMWPKVGSA